MAVRCPRTTWIAPLLLLAGLGGCVNGPGGLSAPGGGSAANYDRHAKRLEVRPVELSAQVGQQVILLATMYDDENKPRAKRQVDWKIEGAGVVLELDEGGFLQGRGRKEDSKSAITFTNVSEHELPPGIDNPRKQVVRAGQTWCVITSASEGQSLIQVYAPEIADAQLNRVVAKVNWIDATWQLPQPMAAQAGSDVQLQTRISRFSNRQPVANYRVRYALDDKGPAAALYPPGAPRNTAAGPRELLVTTGADGVAAVNVSELKAVFGTSNIAIEVQRPDPSQPGGYAVVAQSQTKVDWQAPQVKLKIEGPAAATVNQPFTVTYAVSSAGTIETPPLVLKAPVPPGLELVNSDPKAVVDGNELLWQIAPLGGGKQATVQAVYRAAHVGPITTSASVRTDASQANDKVATANPTATDSDTLRDDQSAVVQITEAKLDIALTGPASGLVDEKLAYQIVLRNTGSGPALNVKVTAQFDTGLAQIDRPGMFETTIDKLEALQTQTLALPLTPRQAGRSAVKALVTADGNLHAESAAIAVDVAKPSMTIQAQGPANGRLNQEVTWTLRVFNPSDVAVGNVRVRALLPPDMAFRRATENGQPVNGAIEWNLGTTIGKQWVDLQVTGVPSKLGPAVLTAVVLGAPLAKRDGDFKTVALVKDFASDPVRSSIEILGVPSLELHAADTPDPAQVGETVMYTITVKNPGSLAASQVELAADLPPQLKPLRTGGAGAGKINGQHVTFAAIPSLQANAQAVFTIEAQALTEGDAKFHAEVKMLTSPNPLSIDELTRILPRPIASNR
jgi:uncharacterized repeat protein (TIGR01451 family)